MRLRDLRVPASFFTPSIVREIERMKKERKKKYVCVCVCFERECERYDI